MVDGPKTLAGLFDGCSQLPVYHFTFGRDWNEACKSCTFWIDNLNGIDVHLRHRDVRLLAISHAPLAKLEAYKKRMGCQASRPIDGVARRQRVYQS